MSVIKETMINKLRQRHSMNKTIVIFNIFSCVRYITYIKLANIYIYIYNIYDDEQTYINIINYYSIDLLQK